MRKVKRLDREVRRSDGKGMDGDEEDVMFDGDGMKEKRIIGEEVRLE